MAEVYYSYGITTQIASIRGRRVIISGIREVVVANREVQLQKSLNYSQ
ncbi:MAG TPA: hypothetical protein QF355_03760 [Candidatus Marinimicrobia bacterium]|nr:hypothetical protein [Candidatus Neomarinimicrobiota bacterium]HJO47956.1 hypothetical protein [Candidatus Scalindua sp.]